MTMVFLVNGPRIRDQSSDQIENINLLLLYQNPQLASPNYSFILEVEFAFKELICKNIKNILPKKGFVF